MIKFSKYEIRDTHCRKCSVCIGVCPRKAIILRADHFPEINQVKCDSCGECMSCCKLRAIKKSFTARFM